MTKARRPSQRLVDPDEGARVALGFRTHSGWAALVAIAGPASAPSAIDRRRIELADPQVPRPVQPYHAAQKLDLLEAESYIEHFTRQALLLAERALREAVDRLRAAGYEVVACGIPLGSGRPPATLEAALASHTMLHTAEGELFRNALIEASKECGLRAWGIRERDLAARGAEELGISPKALNVRLSELGRGLGPPWGQDQKLATLAAWLALAGSGLSPRFRAEWKGVACRPIEPGRFT